MRLKFILASLLATAAPSVAQDETYSFSSGGFPGDGFTWPSQINASDSLSAYEFPYEGRTEFYNDTNNAVMFASNYVAAGNSSVIDGNAMWGNPIATDPYMEMYFYEFFEFDYDEELGEEIILAGVTEISFDFAWATSAGSPTNPPAIGSIVVEAYSYYGDGEINAYPLNGTFTHGLGGSGIGREGRITISGLENIESIYIDFSAIAPPGSMAEFAIDNMEIYVGGGGGGGGGLPEVYPISGGDEFGLEEEFGYGTNVLKGIGPWGFQGGVRNNSGSAAVFSSVFTSPDPELYDPSAAQHTNQPIAQGEVYYPGTEWEINTNTAPSGEYSGSTTVINHSDPNDPDNTFELFWLRLYDPPILTDNTGTAIDPTGVDQITLSNAAAGPHADALRASVRVESITLSDPRFSMTGIALDDRLDPGQSFAGTVSFDDSGLPSGSYAATLTMGMEMTTTQNYLNRSQPVADRVWNLQATVGSGVVTVTVNTGENFATSGLSLGTATTGFTLIDGTSSANQTLTASFDATPPAAGGVNFVNEAVDLTFSSSADLYVMQISYNEGDIPTSFAEEDVVIYVYDTSSSTWVPAIELNSDGGTPPAGAEPFIGTYADFLATLGGGTLDSADLSAYGVDPSTNSAWAVLDHASTFRLGTGEGSLPPETFSITEVGGTYTITYLSIDGEVLAVKGSPDLVNEVDLPDTVVGDGTMKTYSHTPPAGSGRYFYRLIRNPEIGVGG